MRAEGKAFCSDNWYLLAGVLLQKRRPSHPSQATMQPDSHTNGVSASSNGLASTPDLLTALSNGHGSNGHGSNGQHSEGFESQGPQEDGVGDCSGLRHRYSTDAHGAVNTAEDQLDELIQVMTALR